MSIVSKLRESSAKRARYIATIRELRENSYDLGISPLNAKEIAYATVYGK